MRVHGTDISRWDGRFIVPQNPPRPVDFVIQRLTHGVYPDIYYATLKADIQNIPIRGGYHYLTSTPSWKSQCDVFLSKLDSSYHFWSLDVERYDNADVFGRPKAGRDMSSSVILSPLARKLFGGHRSYYASIRM